MNGSLAVRRGVTWLRSLFALLFCMVAIVPDPARAHEVTPAIADFMVKDGQITLELRLNVEAFVAGINLDGLSDTNQTAQAADYDELRALDGEELEPMVRLFAEDWLETFSVQAGGPVALGLSPGSPFPGLAMQASRAPPTWS